MYADGTIIQVSTVDLHKIEYDTQADKNLALSMIQDYPYETTVYELVDKDKPFENSEELFGDYLYVDGSLRRDLSLGDLYLSRSRTIEGASIEHDHVVTGIVSNDLVLLTQTERAALYGAGDVLG